MALQWFRRTQVTGIPGQVVDLIRYRDGSRLARFTLPPEAVVTVEYLEQLGDCYLILHDGAEDLLQAWQASSAVARGAVRLSPALPGYLLTCAIPGTTGTVAPDSSKIKRNWVHRLDIQGANGDLRFGRIILNNNLTMAGYGAWGLLPTAEDGNPALWPIADLLHVVGTNRHLVALKADGKLMVKSWAGTSVPAFYSAAKALTGVIHIEASYDVLHCHLSNGTVVHLADAGSPITALGNSPVIAGWAGGVPTNGIKLAGGVATCQNASQQAALSGITDIVCGITNEQLLVGLLRANGQMRLIDPSNTARNVTISNTTYGEAVEFGARNDAVWVTTDKGWRFALSKNPKNSSVAGSSFHVDDWVNGFRGPSVDQLSLLACPFLATQSRLLVATQGSLTTVYRNTYTESVQTSGVGWIAPQPRLVHDGTALFYAAPMNAALIRPLWTREQREASGVSQASLQVQVTVEGQGASRPVAVFSWPETTAPRLLWQGRSGGDGAVGASWETESSSELALVVAMDDWGVFWHPLTHYTVGTVLRPTGTFGGVVYVCVTAGDSTAAEPTWWPEGQGAVGTAVFEARPFRRPLAHGPVTPTVVTP